MVLRKKAVRFIVLLGIVSLFADITYEGARSINGQYMALLGASGAVVGFVAGFGECIGYFFRMFSGYISDRTEKYWLLTIVGYLINLLAVPLLAFAHSWKWAAVLIILERFGKAIRTPPRDAMLSYASKHTGRGWGFGLHEALDQIGALTGPLLLTFLLFQKQSYASSYLFLAFPALCCLLTLFIAKQYNSNPRQLEIEEPSLPAKGFSRRFWFYVAASSLVAAGYVDFSLIAYHFQKEGAISFQWLPLYYAAAMLVAAISALYLGRLYDKKGMQVIIFSTAASALFALCVFVNSPWIVLLGMLLWGLGMGAQGSIMRSFIADIISPKKRATAYGILNAAYGIFWFIGSAFLGILYDVSIAFVIGCSLGLQLLSLPLFIYVKKARS